LGVVKLSQNSFLSLPSSCLSIAERTVNGTLLASATLLSLLNRTEYSHTSTMYVCMYIAVGTDCIHTC
jgi:hypothetical protein